jgi:hypothetical protein
MPPGRAGRPPRDTLRRGSTTSCRPCDPARRRDSAPPPQHMLSSRRQGRAPPWRPVRARRTPSGGRQLTAAWGACTARPSSDSSPSDDRTDPLRHRAWARRASHGASHRYARQGPTRATAPDKRDAVTRPDRRTRPSPTNFGLLLIRRFWVRIPGGVPRRTEGQGPCPRPSARPGVAHGCRRRRHPHVLPAPSAAGCR